MVTYMEIQDIVGIFSIVRDVVGIFSIVRDIVVNLFVLRPKIFPVMGTSYLGCQDHRYAIVSSIS